jgi:hypothetical protein
MLIELCVLPLQLIVGVLTLFLAETVGGVLKNIRATAIAAHPSRVKASVSRRQYLLMVLLMVVVSPVNRNVRLVNP